MAIDIDMTLLMDKLLLLVTAMEMAPAEGSCNRSSVVSCGSNQWLLQQGKQRST